jgi:hypothetical protein
VANICLTPRPAGCILGGLHRFIEDLGGHHLFFELPMLLLEFVQMLVGGGGHALHPFEEHLDQLVTGLDLALGEETEEEAPSPGGLDVAHVPHVESRRLGSELAYFRMRNPCERRLGCQNRFQPGQTVQPLPEVGERRLAGWGLHARKLRQPVVHLEKGIKPYLVGEGEGVSDLGIQRLMHPGTEMANQAVQRAERWEFAALLNEMLDSDIDQVRWITHRQRGLGHRLHDDP